MQPLNINYSSLALCYGNEVELFNLSAMGNMSLLDALW